MRTEGWVGTRTAPLLIVPRDLVDLLPERIEGADTVHRVLVLILKRLGHRRPPDAPAGQGRPAPVGLSSRPYGPHGERRV